MSTVGWHIESHNHPGAPFRIVHICEPGGMPQLLSTDVPVDGPWLVCCVGCGAMATAADLATAFVCIFSSAHPSS